MSEERGLPANIDAERMVLGSILVDDQFFVQATAILERDDFSLEKHRRIWVAMEELQTWDERIDHITVANTLRGKGQLESCDGLSGIISLQDGMPRIPSIESYCRIVKEKSDKRRVIFACQKAMNQAMLDDDKPAVITESLNETLMGIGASPAVEAQSPADIIHNYEGGISQFMDPSLRPQGIKTGYIKLDDMTEGLRGGQLIIVAGRPAMGKSSFSRNVAQFVTLKSNLPVVMFVLEESRESVLQQMMCSAARVDSHKFRAGYLAQYERDKLNKALADLTASKLLIDDSTPMTVYDMRSRLHKIIKQRGKPALVIADYLQLLSSKGKTENRNQEVSAQTRALKLMAKELDVPFMVLSQLSRAVEQRKGDHRPQLSDLRESGSIEQDADIVGFLFREEVYVKDRDDLRGLGEFILAKQRMGPTGAIPLVWMAGLTKWENRAEDYSVYEEERAI